MTASMTKSPPSDPIAQPSDSRALTPDDLRFQRRSAGLLAIAQDVRMTAHRTFERAHDRSQANQARDIEVLREALATWRPSRPGEESYDNAVRQLVVLALQAAEVAHV